MRSISFSDSSRSYNSVFSLDTVTTYNLLYNASLMVKENVGCALCLDEVIPEYENRALVFKPLEPKAEIGLNIVWKKYQVFSKATEVFLNKLQYQFRKNNSSNP